MKSLINRSLPPKRCPLARPYRARRPVQLQNERDQKRQVARTSWLPRESRNLFPELRTHGADENAISAERT
jgi:hypothetical protein